MLEHLLKPANKLKRRRLLSSGVSQRDNVRRHVQQLSTLHIRVRNIFHILHIHHHHVIIMYQGRAVWEETQNRRRNYRGRA